MVGAPGDQPQGGATQAIPLWIVGKRQRRRGSSTTPSIWDRVGFALADVARAETYRVGYATRAGALASAKHASAFVKTFLLHNNRTLLCRRLYQLGGWALTILVWMAVSVCYSNSCDGGARPGPNTTVYVSAISHGPSWLTIKCREDLATLIGTNAGVVGRFSLYLEDLSNGTTFAIRPDESYEAWSLFKVPVLMTVLKKVEEGGVSIDAMVPITHRQVSYAATPIDDIQGEAAPLKVLAQRMLQLSDNTASMALAALFKRDDFQRTLAVAGIPPAPPDQPRPNLPKVTPRQYAAVLHALRDAAYLNATHSEWVLSLLAESLYDSQIIAGLPEGTRVSHMVGFNGDCGDFHDCGIIWSGTRSYLLCVMSHGSTRAEADRIISSLSRRIWECYASAPCDLP